MSADKKKKRNPQDATLRNVRALKKQIKKLQRQQELTTSILRKLLRED